jgi:signal transduction histidine kinase
MIIKNANKMEELIGELVTFNKIETDHFSFYLQKGNPLEFIELGMANFYVACSEKGINLSVSTENNGEEV